MRIKGVRITSELLNQGSEPNKPMEECREWEAK